MIYISIREDESLLGVLKTVLEPRHIYSKNDDSPMAHLCLGRFIGLLPLSDTSLNRDSGVAFLATARSQVFEQTIPVTLITGNVNGNGR